MTPVALSAAVWVFILLPLLVAWALGLVDILRRDLPRGAKAAWILIVVLLPFVGTLAYFLLRKPTQKEILQAQQASKDRPDRPLEVRQRLPDE